MSEIPPSNPYASYPRPGMGPDANTLRLLADGYFGLNTAFIINVAMNLGANAFVRTANQDSVLPIYGGIALVMFIVVLVVTLPHNKKIGQGLGWSSSGPIVASVLMGLNSAFCCGIIGYIVVQSMAAKKFKEAGAPRGFFGYKKSELYAFIDQIQSQQGGMRPPTI